MRSVWILVLVFFSLQAFALDLSNRYRSPRNPERKVRASTELIVLHTTEAPARSSLNKLCERGEAHYCVTEEGSIYRIVDRDREAFHAGRSMWNGKEDVDKFSIGIECVGYHDKPMGDLQLRAIRDLVKELQKMYRIPDERVVCHSHVAYGAPNRWQKRNHRGRKRCGMLFAMPSVRKRLELSKRPASDADVRAKRLTVGDDYLRQVLYGNVDTMKAHYPAQGVLAASNPSGGIFAWLRDGKAKSSEPPPKSAVSAPPPPPKSAVTARPTAPPKSIAELKSGGWELKGAVTRETSASKLAGSRWNAADTYYTIRNKVVSGKEIDPAHIEKGMGVWLKK